jgi:hypothetical protein
MKLALAVAAIVLATTLAGCGGKSTPPVIGGGTQPPLPADKGAIAGLVIDDVYRPVPKALILIEKAGLTATSDGEGQFTFTGLDPGAYVLKVQAEGHASAPRTVEVVAGQYAEAEVQADRLFNSGPRIVTTEFSVFVPCAVSVVASTQAFDCTLDLSGDTFRAAFEANYTAYGNVTYLVTEMLSNHKAAPGQGALKIVVRDGVTRDDPYYASRFTVDSNYIKVVMRLGEVSKDDAEPGRNQKWTNDRKLETALFPQGAFKSETQTPFDCV